MNIGIIGAGFVGNATKLLECKDVKTYVYDIDPNKCNPKGTTLDSLLTPRQRAVTIQSPRSVARRAWQFLLATARI